MASFQLQILTSQTRCIQDRNEITEAMLVFRCQLSNRFDGNWKHFYTSQKTKTVFLLMPLNSLTSKHEGITLGNSFISCTGTEIWDGKFPLNTLHFGILIHDEANLFEIFEPYNSNCRDVYKNVSEKPARKNALKMHGIVSIL